MVVILAARIAAKRGEETLVAGVVGQLMARKGPVVSHDRGEAALRPSQRR